MSEYTVQLRFVCESLAGLDSSVCYTSVDDVIEKAIPSIFDFNFPIFDENYRYVIEKKILKHYYTREIGLETVGMWKLKLDTKLNEIMPYYNELYKTQLIKFNPLYDTDIERVHTTRKNGNNETTNTEERNTRYSSTTDSDRNIESTSNNSSREDGNFENTQNLIANNKSMYSDTPQGGISDLENGHFLTNATIENNNSNNTEKNKNEINRVDDGSLNSNEKNSINVDTDNEMSVDGNTRTIFNDTTEYSEHVFGNSGGVSISKRLAEFRETLINIDMLVINELSDLFFGLW